MNRDLRNPSLPSVLPSHPGLQDSTLSRNLRLQPVFLGSFTGTHLQLQQRQHKLIPALHMQQILKSMLMFYFSHFTN
jgi:hypothetical protein